MTILELRDIYFEQEGRFLFHINHLTINQGEVIGLIGRNGAGKSSLLKLIDDKIRSQKHPVNHEWVELKAGQFIDKSGGQAVSQLILKSLKQDKALYLLDEPTTFLDSRHTQQVISSIQRSTASFCIASHDRQLLEEICQKIWLIDKGEVTEYKGNYDSYLQEKSYQAQAYEKNVQKYDKQSKAIKKSLKKLKETSNKSKAKSKKLSHSEYRLPGSKTRIQNKQKKLQKAILSKQKQLENQEKPQNYPEDYQIAFSPKSQNKTYKTLYLPEKTYQINNKVLWHSPAFHFQSGDCILLIGDNGTGKTSFLNYVNDNLPDHFKTSYFRQNQLISFEDERAVLDLAQGYATDLSQKELINLLAQLNIKDKMLTQSISNLSNGEKVKLELLCLLLQDLDILLLDEVTNFLDLQTIEALEKLLRHFQGILIMVSHDRTFVQNIATEIINFDKTAPLKLISPEQTLRP